MPRPPRHRAQALSGVFLHTARVLEAFSRLDEFLNEGWENGHCVGQILVGQSRLGKSRLVDQWLAPKTNSCVPDDDRLRVLIYEAPADATLPAFLTGLLTKLRDPAPGVGDLAAKTERIYRRMKSDQYDLFVLDEAQRLIDVDTDRVRRKVSNWVTAFLNADICPALLVGELHAERAFEGVTHSEGRTRGSIVLTPYRCDNPADRQEWRVVMHEYDQQIGMPQLSELGRTETALRIYVFARGRLGEAARLIRQAASHARRLGRPSITHDSLAVAVDELRIGSAARRLLNPFRVETVEPVPPEVADEQHQPPPPKRRGGKG